MKERAEFPVQLLTREELSETKAAGPSPPECPGGYNCPWCTLECTVSV